MNNRRFAQETSVPVEKTKAEIEMLVTRYGASGFRSGWSGDISQVEFAANDRVIRFTLPLPAKDSREFTRTKAGNIITDQSKRLKLWEQGCRQRWRALHLAIKAKLEAVACGISEFEAEFLAQIVDPITGRTVGENVRPMIAARYEGRDVPLLGLPSPDGGDT